MRLSVFLILFFTLIVKATDGNNIDKYTRNFLNSNTNKMLSFDPSKKQNKADFSDSSQVDSLFYAIETKDTNRAISIIQRYSYPILKHKRNGFTVLQFATLKDIPVQELICKSCKINTDL